MVRAPSAAAGGEVRHAIVIAGPQGIGKDTIFEAIAPAIGAWNCDEIKPNDLFGDFNEHVRTVLLRISEVVDLHEISQFKFNEATKTLIAGNPEFIRVDPKYGTQYHVRNVCGVVMTTNHGTGGLYLPEDDRRHYVVESVERGVRLKNVQITSTSSTPGCSVRAAARSGGLPAFGRPERL